MRSLIPFVGLATFATSLTAQTTPNYCDASTNNTFRVVSTALSPTTSRHLPWVFPAGYTSTGVPAGTRAWNWTPKERFQAGSDPFRTGAYVTVTGFTQTVFVGPEVQTFPTTTETYQFETGLAPADPGASSTMQHTANGNLTDLVLIPQSTLSVPTAGSGLYEHSFTLTTPIQVTQTDLLLFVTYRGGEIETDPAGGQTLGADWNGGTAIPGASYWGFATPSTAGVRTVTQQAGQYRGKIGIMTDEPVFVATGYHANQYDAAARANERFRGVSLMANDWALNTWANSQPTLWFDFEGGARYGTGIGTFTALFNLGTQWWPVALPWGYGNLLLSPGDPLLFGFADAGQFFQLGGSGEYHFGPSVAYSIPSFGASAIGMWVKMQGICANLNLGIPSATDIAFTNSTSMYILN